MYTPRPIQEINFQIVHEAESTLVFFKAYVPMEVKVDGLERKIWCYWAFFGLTDHFLPDNGFNSWRFNFGNVHYLNLRPFILVENMIVSGGHGVIDADPWTRTHVHGPIEFHTAWTIHWIEKGELDWFWIFKYIDFNLVNFDFVLVKFTYVLFQKIKFYHPDIITLTEIEPFTDFFELRFRTKITIPKCRTILSTIY